MVLSATVRKQLQARLGLNGSSQPYEPVLCAESSVLVFLLPVHQLALKTE